MELVIGGVGQGKLSYVLKKYGYSEEDLFFSPKTQGNRPVFYHLEHWVQDVVEAGNDPVAALNPLLDSGFDGVFVCDEVGCGVVPATPGDRAWREAVGRICCLLAERADVVTRVFCGIPFPLKSPEGAR